MSDMEKKDSITHGSTHVHDATANGDAHHQKFETTQENHEGDLHRGLKNRHIAMISIGGVIGTGLFLGTANALAHGGPIGLILGYAIMGSVTYSVMVSLGEMISYLPIAGGHITLAGRFVDPALAFAMGYNYWYNWLIVLPAELSACAVLINFWVSPDKISNAVWVTIVLVVCTAINFLGSRGYGEAEFWFASIKVITIIGLIILGLILDFGGGPDHKPIGFQYWRNPGPFVQYLDISGPTGRFLGFWSVLIQAGFSFIGTEIVAIAAGEAKNPRRNIPRAIKRVYIRILLFYIGGTFVISLLVPSNDKSLGLHSTGAKSPFVIAMKRSGIKALPSIVNFCFITSAASAASSDLYTSSRALYAMAINGSAPRIFAKTTKNGLPILALCVSVAFSFLSYMGVKEGSAKVFEYFSNLTSLCGLLTWWGICLTYIRFYQGLRAQGIDRKALPFANWGQPFLSYYGLFMTSVIVLFNGFAVFIRGHWVVATFITSYLPLPFFFILYFAYKFIRRTRIVRPEEMDFQTGIKEIEAAETEEEIPTTFWGKVWHSLF